MVANPQKFYSSQEYLALENSAEYKSEFFNGHIYAMAGASPTHAQLTANITGLLHQQLRGKTCRSFSSDLRVQISETGAYVYPDVTVACPPLQFSEDDPNALTNPVVVIEVLSPSTEAHDRGAKWAHYQRLESLCDYILVSQDQMRLEHYERQEDGSWRYSVAENGEAFVTLESIGCRLKVSEVYERVEFISA
jgi:Uma2 family endonuclease